MRQAAKHHVEPGWTFLPLSPFDFRIRYMLSYAPQNLSILAGGPLRQTLEHSSRLSCAGDWVRARRNTLCLSVPPSDWQSKGKTMLVAWHKYICT